MTIKELENRTGMTRANIRFYEGEGLLSPRRLENGYRDYSEEDVGTLEKIKLLRQLQLDIDTIRKVQQGTLTLEQALFVQATRLEGDRAVIERAAEVCRGLEHSGVEYAALDPRPWLQQLQQPERPNLPESPSTAVPGEEERDWEPRACYCPWQRLFARALDMTLYDTLINGLWLVLLHDFSLWNFQTGSTIGRWVSGTALLVLALALEPLWLHFWGWTPGKWLFGLKVRDENGDKLSLAWAWERSWQMFQEGYGYTIPFWEQWKMWKCREMGLEGRDCHWDSENAYRYTKEKRRFKPAAVYVLAAVLCIGIQTAALRWGDLPINRGDLTVAEFCQNYNQYYKRYYIDGLGFESPSTLRLDREGHWVEREPGNTVVISGESTITMTGADGSTVVIENVVDGTTVWDQPEFTLENGWVRAVTLRMRTQDSLVWPGTNRDRLSLLALAGAVDGVNLFNFDRMDWLGPWDEIESAWEDAEIDWKGLHISRKVEYTGYEPGAGLVSTGEDGPRHCEITTTISLTE